MIMVVDADLPFEMLKKHYECPYFRILVIGRANAGKTTILEKVCGVAQGTKPMIYDEHGVELEPNISPISPTTPASEPNLKPRFKLLGSMKRSFSRKSVPSQMHLTVPPPPPSVTHLTPSMEVSCVLNLLIDFH